MKSEETAETIERRASVLVGPSGRAHPGTTLSPENLTLDAVSYGINERRILDDISLCIRKGEFFTLLGPSGCGKTTLLRLIAGFETPQGGSITLGGTDLTKLPAAHRPVNTVFLLIATEN